MKGKYLLPVVTAMVLTGHIVKAGPQVDEKQLRRGEYLSVIGGCNDCHTPGYPQADGKVPKAEWLVGSPVGFSGPWGTTYPANLRNLMQSITEKEWLERVRKPMRPPMPWFNLRDMSDADLKAMYAFINSLGAKGADAPVYAPPSQKVSTPYIEFFPKNLPQQHAKN